MTEIQAARLWSVSDCAGQRSVVMATSPVEACAIIARKLGMHAKPEPRTDRRSPRWAVRRAEWDTPTWLFMVPH